MTWREAMCASVASEKSDIFALAVLQDGSLASGLQSGLINLYDQTGHHLGTLEGHTGAVCSLAPLPDGHLASGSGDRSIRVWAVVKGCCEAVLQGHGDYVRAIVALP